MMQGAVLKIKLEKDSPGKAILEFLKEFSKINYLGINLADCLWAELFINLNSSKKDCKTAKILLRYGDYLFPLQKPFFLAKYFLLTDNRIKNKSDSKRIAFLVESERQSIQNLIFPIFDFFKKSEILMLTGNSKVFKKLSKDYDTIYLKRIYPIGLEQKKEISSIIKKIIKISKKSNSKFINSKAFRIWIEKKAFFAMIFIYKMDKLFSENAISKIVCPFDASFFGRIVTLTAKKYNIKSVTLQHGIFGSPLYSSLTAEKIIVWGKKPKKWLSLQGLNSDRILIGGSPAFILGSKNSLFNKKIKNCLLATTHCSKQKKEKVLNIFASAFSDSCFIPTIRPHPTEEKAFYSNFIRGTNIKLSNNNRLSEDLRSNDLVVSYYSSAIFDALSLGKPVIILDPFEEKNPTSFLVSNLPKAKNSDELRAITKKLNTNKKFAEKMSKVYKKTLIENVSFFGKDSARISSNLIKKL